MKGRERSAPLKVRCSERTARPCSSTLSTCVRWISPDTLTKTSSVKIYFGRGGKNLEAYRKFLGLERRIHFGDVDNARNGSKLTSSPQLICEDSGDFADLQSAAGRIRKIARLRRYGQMRTIKDDRETLWHACPSVGAGAINGAIQ
jgi:hypothetical protein